MSGVMNPLETLLGVVISRDSSRRALMLPSLLATYPRAYRRRPASTISARSCSSTRVLAKLSSAFLGAEVVRRRSHLEESCVARRHPGAAHRIAYELDGRRPPAFSARSVRRPAEGFDHPVDQPPERPGNQQQENREQDEPGHGLLGVEPGFACADAIPSSARRAACPSGLSGDSSTTFCHSVAAPFRSCLPNAST